MVSIRHAVGWLSVMAVFAVQMAVYSRCQPQIVTGNGRGDDGVTYGAVAEQILNREAIRGAAPFVYRLGESWLAAQYARTFGVSVNLAFRHTNAVMVALALTLVYALATRFSSPLFAALASVLYSLPWWSYTRLVWFYPVQNDLPWLLLMLVSLCLVTWWPREAVSTGRTVAFALLCLIAPLTRETGVLVPIVWICSRAWFLRRFSLEVLLGDPPAAPRPESRVVRREVFLSVLFLCLSLAGIAMTRWAAHDSAGFSIGGASYGFLPAALDSVRRNTLWHVALSCCLAYGGPLMALFVLYHRYGRARAAKTPALVVYWAGIALLALLGGVNTLRFLSWASPIAFVFLAHLSQKFWNEPRSRAGRVIGRGLLLGSGAYYVSIIHPFGGYYENYTAWMVWGGLQSSDFGSVRYLATCLLLLAAFVVVGRTIVPDGIGALEKENPPYPEPR